MAEIFPVGLIIWGISIDKAYHWIVGQIAFFICKFSQFLPPKVQPYPNSGILSRRRHPNRQHGHYQLHRRLLPLTIHERYNILLRFSQFERLRRPRKPSPHSYSIMVGPRCQPF